MIQQRAEGVLHDRRGGKNESGQRPPEGCVLSVEADDAGLELVLAPFHHGSRPADHATQPTPQEDTSPALMLTVLGGLAAAPRLGAFAWVGPLALTRHQREEALAALAEGRDAS